MKLQKQGRERLWFSKAGKFFLVLLIIFYLGYATMASNSYSWVRPTTITSSAAGGGGGNETIANVTNTNLFVTSLNVTTNIITNNMTVRNCIKDADTSSNASICFIDKHVVIYG